MAARPQFYFKPVAVVSGRFFALGDDRTELAIGARTQRQGDRGFEVFRSVEEANRAGKRALPGATLTVVKVMAWGDTKVNRGRLFFQHICPLFDVGWSHDSVTRRDKSSGRKHHHSRSPELTPKWLQSLPYWDEVSLPVPVRIPPALRRRAQRTIVSVKRSLEYPAVEIKTHRSSQSTVRKKLPPISFKERVHRMERDANALERELAEVERRAALLQLEEELASRDSVDHLLSLCGP